MPLILSPGRLPGPTVTLHHPAVPQIRAGPLQMPVHFAVWLQINLFVDLRRSVSSPRASQRATPSVSLSHNKSSVVPAGTECTRSLKPCHPSWVAVSKPARLMCMQDGAGPTFQEAAGSLAPTPRPSPHLSLCLLGDADRGRDQSLCLRNLGSPEIPQVCFQGLPGTFKC